MSLNWEIAFKQKITRWRHRRLIRPPDDPFQETLVETRDQTNAAFYPVRHFLCYLPYFGVRCWEQFHEKNKEFTM